MLITLLICAMHFVLIRADLNIHFLRLAYWRDHPCTLSLHWRWHIACRSESAMKIYENSAATLIVNWVLFDSQREVPELLLLHVRRQHGARQTVVQCEGRDAQDHGAQSFWSHHPAHHPRQQHHTGKFDISWQRSGSRGSKRAVLYCAHWEATGPIFTDPVIIKPWTQPRPSLHPSWVDLAMEYLIIWSGHKLPQAAQKEAYLKQFGL